MKPKFNFIKKAVPFLLASLISFNVSARKRDCEFIDANNDGKPEIKKCVIKKGNSLEHRIEHLDTLGNTKKEELYSEGIYTLTEYKRNDKGKIIEEKKSIDNNRQKGFDYITKTKYDDKGNKTSIWKDSDGDLKPEQIIELDEKGNITKRCNFTKRGLLCEFYEKGELMAQGIDKNHNGNCEIKVNYNKNKRKESVFSDFNDDGNTDEITYFNSNGKNKTKEIFYLCKNDTLISRINSYRPNGKKDSSVLNIFADDIPEKITLYDLNGKKQKKFINHNSDKSFEEKLYFENNKLVKQELDSCIWKYNYNNSGEIKKIEKINKKSENLDFYLSLKFTGGRLYDVKMKKNKEVLKEWYLTYKSTKEGYYDKFEKILKEAGNTGKGYKEISKENKN